MRVAAFYGGYFFIFGAKAARAGAKCGGFLDDVERIDPQRWPSVAGFGGAIYFPRGDLDLCGFY